MAYTIVIDAGHGGSDPGAVYQNRNEKDDVLKLALAVGKYLENCGVDVEYTRVADVYNTPYEKAMMANNSNSDLFVSIHRNISQNTDANGIETLVFSNNGKRAELAGNINNELEEIGFANRGIVERPNLVVLKRTKMPAVMIEVGFMNADGDNEILDTKFDDVAQAIASGILKTINIECKTKRILYRVQVGAFRNKDYAYKQFQQLQREGYPAFIVFDNDLYKVQVGAFEILDNAIRMEQSLRSAGYGTYIVTQ